MLGSKIHSLYLSKLSVDSMTVFIKKGFYNLVLNLLKQRQLRLRQFLGFLLLGSHYYTAPLFLGLSVKQRSFHKDTPDQLLTSVQHQSWSDPPLLPSHDDKIHSERTAVPQSILWTAV